jgi:hypothetical protein
MNRVSRVLLIAGDQERQPEALFSGIQFQENAQSEVLS